MIWCCPCCRSVLEAAAANLRCAECDREFEVIAGIPDLRVEADSWIDFQSDLQLARQLAQIDGPVEDLIRAVFRARPDWDEARIERRTREALRAPMEKREEVRGWLGPLDRSGPILDLGCGSGPAIIAMQLEGHDCIGVDVSMTWLVVAQRFIKSFGFEPVLAAAVGEALPLPDHSVKGTISLDVIEHVRNVPAYVCEIGRVLTPGGSAALSTPNRFSVTAEPHVFVWGVGWLPRRFQKAYVRWKSGKSYDDTDLLSYWDLRRIFGADRCFTVAINIPQVLPNHITHFTKTKRIIARVYNSIAEFSIFRPFFILIAPFFHIKYHRGLNKISSFLAWSMSSFSFCVP